MIFVKSFPSSKMFMTLIHRIKSEFLSWALKISYNWPQLIFPTSFPLLPNLKHQFCWTITSLALSIPCLCSCGFPSKNLSFLLPAYLNSNHTASPSSILGNFYFFCYYLFSSSCSPSNKTPCDYSWQYFWLSLLCDYEQAVAKISGLVSMPSDWHWLPTELYWEGFLGLTGNDD